MKNSDTDPSFEQELNERILSSEYHRAGIMAVVVAVLMIIAAINNIFFLGADPKRWLEVRYFYYIATVVGVGFVVNEMLARHYIAKRLQRHLFLSSRQQYFNVLLETSIPTLILIAHSMMSPTYGGNVGGPTASIYFLFIVLSSLRMKFSLCLFTGLVATVNYALWWGINFRLHWERVPAAQLNDLISGGVVRCLLLFVGGAAAGFVAMKIREDIIHIMRAMREQQKIVDVFGQYVSPKVAQQLLSQAGDLRPQNRLVCILVFDIRNFLLFSQDTPPEKVLEYLNIMWNSAVAVIHRHGGIVNKFLGDGFMAVFGAPIALSNPAANAVRASLEIFSEIKKMVGQGIIPHTVPGMGLHIGEVVVGNVGSKDRQEYAVIGDAVNLAFRIEDLNKQFSSHILVSEEVKENMGDIAVNAQEVGLIRIRGREACLNIFKLA
ncbi:MAG: adenylate/guanylate cyclase domain-containing protein [bacterium]